MSSAIIQLHNLQFTPYLDRQEIGRRVEEMGAQISRDYAGRRPLYLVMLKGAILFAADLVRACSLDGELSFVRLSSYQGVQSTGKLHTHLPPEPSEIQGRDVIIIEDIIDSGHTMAQFLPQLAPLEPASVAVATLLFKPDMLQHNFPIQYIGFSIPPKFVVGYGLDYDGLGRTLPDIYQLVES